MPNLEQTDMRAPKGHAHLPNQILSVFGCDNTPSTLFPCRPTGNQPLDQTLSIPNHWWSNGAVSQNKCSGSCILAGYNSKLSGRLQLSYCYPLICELRMYCSRWIVGNVAESVIISLAGPALHFC